MAPLEKKKALMPPLTMMAKSLFICSYGYARLSEQCALMSPHFIVFPRGVDDLANSLHFPALEHTLPGNGKLCRKSLRWGLVGLQCHQSQWKPLFAWNCIQIIKQAACLSKRLGIISAFGVGVHGSVCTCKICLEGIGIKLNWVK